MLRVRTLLLVLHVCLLASVKAQYKIPAVLVEGLSPKGLRVSIPDQKNIKLFGFHGKLNKEIEDREIGIFVGDVDRPVNGRWTFLDESARLKVGDVIYYRIKVDYYGGTETITYRKNNQSSTITELISIVTTSPNILTPKSTTTTQTPSTIRATTAVPSTTLPSTTTTRTITTPKPTPKAATETTNPECKKTPTTVNGKPSCKGTLIFEERFGEISQKKWRTEVRFPQEPDYEFVIYQNSAENLYVEKNMLHIKPTLVDERLGPGFVSEPAVLDLGENCTGIPESYECVQRPMAWIILPPVFSAQISTKDRFSFLYGVVEIRARLPKGDWIYPQLLLRSRSDAYGPGYDSGLIKIAFTPGNANLSKQLSGGCVLGDSVVARNYGLKSISSLRDWTFDFHVFRMEWKPSRITLSVDDQIYGNVYAPDEGFASKERELNIDPTTARRWRRGGAFAPFDKEMFLSLGIGVGGLLFADRKDGTKPWSNDDPKAQLNFYKAQNIWRKTWIDNTELVVDYVKIWAL